MAALATSPNTAGSPRHEHVAHGPGIEGDRVIALSRVEALVASKSEPGVWHRVTWRQGSPTCTCRGFSFRGARRHPRAASEAIDEEVTGR